MSRKLSDAANAAPRVQRYGEGLGGKQKEKLGIAKLAKREKSLQKMKEAQEEIDLAQRIAEENEF